MTSYENICLLETQVARAHSETGHAPKLRTFLESTVRVNKAVFNDHQFEMVPRVIGGPIPQQDRLARGEAQNVSAVNGLHQVHR